jgi:undecaprenyl pyrophosphate phosphatase UppP
MTNPERTDGWKQWGFTVLLALPSMFCLAASAQFSGESDYKSSALWFIFQVGQYLAVVCALIGIGICFYAYADEKTSRVALGLMVATVLSSIYLLWLGIHIYRSPWF